MKLISTRLTSIKILILVSLLFIASLYGNKAINEKLLMEDITQNFEAGKSFETFRSAKAFLGKYPNSIHIPQIYYLLGATENNFYRSIYYLRKTIQDFKNSYWALRANIAIAQKYYSAGNYKNASMEYKKLIEEHPEIDNIDEITFYLALSLYKNKQYKQSRTVLLQLIKKYKKSNYLLQAKLYLGHIYLEQKKYKQALKVYSKNYTKIKKNINRAFILENMGKAYYFTGNKKQGLATFNNLISLYPDSPSAKRVKKLYFSY